MIPHVVLERVPNGEESVFTKGFRKSARASVKGLARRTWILVVDLAHAEKERQASSLTNSVLRVLRLEACNAQQSHAGPLQLRNGVRFCPGVRRGRRGNERVHDAESRFGASGQGKQKAREREHAPTTSGTIGTSPNRPASVPRPIVVRQCRMRRRPWIVAASLASFGRSLLCRSVERLDKTPKRKSGTPMSAGAMALTGSWR